MARKISRKGLIKKLDMTWARLGKTRIGYCERCERRPPEVILDADHIFGRTNRRLRWDPRNCCVLCRRCHLYWKHKEPIEFTDWIRTVRNNDVRYLHEAQWEITHYSDADLLEILADLQAELELELAA